MAWTFDQIQNEWLGGGHIAASEDECVSAFERVERFLGWEWLDAAQTSGRGRVSRGTAPTARVIEMGKHLVCTEDVKNVEGLVRRIRRGDVNAEAELTALYLLRSNSTKRALSSHRPLGGDWRTFGFGKMTAPGPMLR